MVATLKLLDTSKVELDKFTGYKRAAGKREAFSKRCSVTGLKRFRIKLKGGQV